MNNRNHHKNRRSIRLRDYDYSSPGEYFVTICTHKRECLFGDVVDGEMGLNEIGEIDNNEWLKTETIRDNVELGAFIIMPNHMHAIFGIVESLGAYRDTPLPRDANSNPSFKSPSKTVGAIVRGYKSAVTTKINTLKNSAGQKIWQRNYYEHIIRNEKSFRRIQNYIINNPAKWGDDMNHPDNLNKG